MQEIEFAGKTLQEMLTQLGIEASVHPEPDQWLLEIETPESHKITGSKGDRLDDIQYLVNRIIIEHFPDCPKIRVDCDQFREREEQRLRDEIRQAAARVRESGKPRRLRAMNAYYRKLAYDVLAEEPDVGASSPPGKQRFKRILVEPKPTAES